MSTLRFAIIVCAIGISGAAFAQTPTADQRGACKTDYEKFCSGIAPGGGRIVACLSKQRDQLSNSCTKALYPETSADRFVGAVVDQRTIKMEPSGGVYVVRVRFNDTITLPAVVDSGAADVSIPADIVSTLMRTKTITGEDFLGEQTYILADGSRVPSHRFRIRSLKVGNKTVENVVGSVASVNATILLGQSFLSKFKSWSVDNEQHTLILR
jgi:predicted aspartyl protease